jgi:hypothetical protein
VSPTIHSLHRQPSTTGPSRPSASRADLLVRALVGMEVFLAAGAVLGAVGLVTGGIDLGDATQDLPFGSPVLAGVALAVLNGVLPAVVAVAGIQGRPWADVGHLVVGVVLVGWIVLQVGFIGLGSWLQVLYAAYGLLIAALAVIALRRRRPGSTPTAQLGLRR